MDADKFIQLQKFVEFERARLPNYLHIADWALREIERLRAAEAERDALKAEVEALRKDAERYRWLRVQPDDTNAPRIDVVYWTANDACANSGVALRLDALDSAVDDAMKEQSK